MLQRFTATTHPGQGPARLDALRAALTADGLHGVLVPRADAHQGEYVAPCDERLAWLTGFTGSAGFAIVLPHIAGLFVDGRYRLQVRAQTAAEAFTPVDWPETKPAAWLAEHAPTGAQIGFDPWLHTVAEIDTLRTGLAGSTVTLVDIPNPIDPLWHDRPAPPAASASAYPDDLAGATAAEKRGEIARTVRDAGHDCAVLTLPDSIAWLLNIRGADIARIPIVQAFALVHADATVDLFAAPDKLDGLQDHLGPDVRIASPTEFLPRLEALTGTVRLDRQSAPVAVHAALVAGPATVVFDRDPCVLPKACKRPAELAAARQAHRRDAAAMAAFLAWADAALDDLAADKPGADLTEIGLVRELEACRQRTGALRDIAFETICGAGPNGAIVHYRVTEDTDRALRPGELVLIDSGGQYLDGTTDITRTLAVGPPDADARAAYTRVLQGLIAISRVRFPEGLAGRDLDPLARVALWAAGQDYGHGTGHGVGQYLSVHEGPQRISRQGTEPLRPGMILSNEPGYYREGVFGIRLENLIVVEEAAPAELPEGARRWLGFETLTYVPFERALIDVDLLTPKERAWVDAYHAETLARLTDVVDEQTRVWLGRATAPL